MAYTVKFRQRPVWVGRTLKGTTYTLHRASISAEKESWELPGYLLWAMNPPHVEPVEFYADASVEPGTGIGERQIGVAEATDQQLSEPNRNDIVEFADLFRVLCEENNDPLQESELIV